MRTLFNNLVLASVSLMFLACSTTNKGMPSLSKEKLGNMDNVYVYDNVYITGQPDSDTVKDLKDQGFSAIISLREEKETATHMSSKKMAKDAGLKFYQIPIPKEGEISDAWVDSVSAIVEKNKNKKILLHCEEGDRAKTWIGAELIKNKKKNADEVIGNIEKLDLVNPYWIKSLRKYSTPKEDY